MKHIGVYLVILIAVLVSAVLEEQCLGDGRD